MRLRIAIICVFLVLGAMVNVAVAWVLSLMVQPSRLVGVTYLPTHARTDDGWAWTLDVWEGGGVRDTHSHWWQPEKESVPRWAEPHPLTAVRSFELNVIGPRRRENIRSAGFPLRSQWCHAIITHERTQGDWHTTVQWNGAMHVGIGHEVLPLRPIWPGFIINTLFYAALVGLLVWSAIAGARFVFRRSIRRRRGQCEKCAYPVGTSPVCTECGAALLRNDET